LITKDKEIVHVKHYGGSAVLSYLFSHGVVSGELFIADEDFRILEKRLMKNFPTYTKWPMWHGKVRIAATNYTII